MTPVADGESGLVPHLSDADRKRYATMKDPLFRMASAVYGHPRSGQIFVNKLLDVLKNKGWAPIPGEPALLRKGEAMVAVYVEAV